MSAPDPEDRADRPLRIWIVQNGEEVPTDPGPPRLLRQALLAELLTRRGHEVTFWTPSFNHQQKIQRTAGREHQVPQGYRVMLLPSRDYQRNVSFTRIRSHQDAAAAFLRLAPMQPEPDLVICGYPTIELAHAGVSYAHARGIPSVVDFRDQWPDIWRDQLPRVAHGVSAPVFRYWRRLQRDLVSRATSVCGITDEFVDWALQSCGRSRSDLDVAFPLAPPRPRMTDEQLAAARNFWADVVGPKESGAVWCTYAGGLGRRTDLMTVVRAVELLDARTAERLRVVICGKGDLEKPIAEAARRHGSLTYAGRRNAAEIRALMDQCDFGIIAYRETSDYMMSYPNKMGELLSYGLPILTGLGGVTWSLLERHGLGTRFTAGDPRSCAAAMAELVANGHPDGVTEKAREVYRHTFNPDLVYPRYAAHVERVAAHARVQGPRSS